MGASVFELERCAYVTTGVCMYLYTRMSEFLQLHANICTDYSIIVVAFVVFAATIFIHAYFKSQITLSYRNIILMHPIKDNFLSEKKKKIILSKKKKVILS